MCARKYYVRSAGEVDDELGRRGRAAMEVLSHEEEDSVIAGGSLRLSSGFWSGREESGGVGFLYV